MEKPKINLINPEVMIKQLIEKYERFRDDSLRTLDMVNPLNRYAQGSLMKEKEMCNVILKDLRELEVNRFPEPFTPETRTFLLVNALRGLTPEQQDGLCFDLYERSANKKQIADKINNPLND